MMSIAGFKWAFMAPFAAAILLSGCSYLFRAGVQGSYLSSDRTMVGYVTSRTEKLDRGTLSIGTADKMECQGEYRVSSEGLSILGVSLKDKIYKGEIFCLDGRIGSFELVSKTKGRTGEIAGTIGGEEFRAKLIEPMGKDCGGDDYCLWGVNWTYEREREQMAVLAKVRAAHRPEEF